MLKAQFLKLHMTVQDKTIMALMMIPALFCLCLGIYYWVRLIGVFPGDLWRFDLMPWQWRLLCCALAVIYPIAACGLWAASRWGIILWAAGAIGEFCAYGLYHAYFGAYYGILVLHIIFFGFYAFLCYWLRQNKKTEAQAVAEY